MKSDLRIENLDIRELEHRLEMAMSSPLLADWDCNSEPENWYCEDEELCEDHDSGQCEYGWGS